MIQAPDSGAATPAQSTPATPAPVAPTPAPEPPALSTSVMTDRIRDQLTGKKTTTATPPVPGSEPSPATPGQTQPSSDSAPPPAPSQPAAPEPDDDDTEAAPGAFPPEAVAALSRERKAKREAKATAKALAEENAALKLRLAPQPPATQPPQAPPATPPAPVEALKTDALIAAETLEAEQEGLRNWARTQVNAIQRAVHNGDATAAIANLQTQVSKHNVTLPADADAVLVWLEEVRTAAEDRLEVARGDVRFLRQDSQRRGEAIRSNSQALATEWAPQMVEAGSEQAKRAEMIRTHFPHLDQHPLGPRFIAAAIRGWEVIDAELTAKGTKPAAGRPAPVAVPPAARLPSTPAPVIPARPAEGKETAKAIFAKFVAAQNDPSVPQEERDRLKAEWVKAGVSGR